MKIKDLKFVDEHNGYSFIRQCLFWDSWKDGSIEYNKFVKSLIRKSVDTNDFVMRYLDVNNAISHGYYKEQSYQVMLSRCDSRAAWYYCRECLGNKCKKTWSDAGSLKIGNDGMSILISNNHGDGETRYAVLDKSEFYADSVFNYQTIVKGDNINIYSYDCGEDINETLPEGQYRIYSYDGLIAIVRI